MIAFRIFRVHPDVFIQIKRRNGREIQPDRLMHLDEHVIQSNRRAPRRQPQDARGLQIELPRDDLGRFPAHAVIIFGKNNPHNNPLFSYPVLPS